ncbi:MAG: hypothetical protein ACTHMS_10755 [Jatrophihabitans sp.]|uniref:hypothetical protein n=1 Tax=Jatrophihabitans sp. TaxID=1932789 RepID=UPI003F81368F
MPDADAADAHAAGDTAAGRPLRAAVRRAVPPVVRYRVRGWLLDTPGVSEVFCAADPFIRTWSRITARTQIVIDGFPRSANSYARAAFLAANPGVLASTHLHTHRAIERAVTLGVPALVLVRDPRPVIASAMQYTPEVPALAGLRAWLRYYGPITELLDTVVIADFAEVTTDIGAVICRLNERHGTSFDRYERSDEADRALNDEIDTWTAAQVGPDRLAGSIAHPSPLRRSTGDVLAGLDRRSAAALDRAVELYRSLPLH